MSPRKVGRKTTQRVRQKPVAQETTSEGVAMEVNEEEKSEVEKPEIENKEKPSSDKSTHKDKEAVVELSGSAANKIEENDEASKNRRGRKRKLEALMNDLNESTASTASVGHGRRKKFQLFGNDFLPREVGDRVLSCGEGEQLGHPGRNSTRKPRAIATLPEDKKVAQVAAGGVHSLVLLEDGSIYSCGINEKGTVPAVEVEAEGSTDKLTPIKFTDEVRRHGKFVMVTAGASFSAGLTQKGSVVAWGNIRDTSGCIETHKILTEMERRPVVIIHHQHRVIVKIAAGENHLVMLSTSGELLTFGDGSMGQLGRSTRVSVIRSQYMVSETGNSLLVSVKEKGKNKMVIFDEIMAGGYWTAARAIDGRIFVCGLNNFGHLGIATPEINQNAAPGEKEPELRVMRPTVSPAYGGHKFIQLCGVQHMIALDDEGNVYGIGKNTDNALGLGTWTGNSDTEHWKYTKLEKIKFDTRIVGVAAKLGCSLAWDSEGKAYAWGCDTSGQLGLGIKEDDDEKVVPQPKLITSAHLDGFRVISASIADNHALFLAKKI